MKVTMPSRRNNNHQGFTIIELLVIGPILMAIIAFMMSYLFNQYGYLVAQNTKVNLQEAAQTAIFSMQDDVFFSNAFVSKLNDNLTDANAPSGGWTSSTDPTVFIISTPALTASHRNANRQPVYINTLGCTPDSVKTQNDALYNNIVYWVSGSNLYRRVVSAPSNMSTCGTSWQKQSCPSDKATNSCQPDNLLTDRLGSFTITYYGLDGAVVTTPEQARAVKISLDLTNKAYAQTVDATYNITLRRINQ